MEFASLIVRPFQLIFLAIVLGLSISLYRGQYAGSVPAITTFSIACGALGVIAMILGIVAGFVSAMQGLIMLAVDGLTTLFFLASSIAMAVKLGVHSCNGSRPAGWNDTKDGTTPPNPYCTYNGIINGGAINFHPDGNYLFEYYEPNSWFVSRCMKSQALDAFLFFSLATFIVSLALDARAFKKGKSGSYA